VNLLADFGGMIIQKPGHHVRQRLVIVDFPRHLLGCIACPNDEQSLAALPFADIITKKRQTENTLTRKPEADTKPGNKKEG